jgi:P-type Ca2+ transporter type 2C
VLNFALWASEPAPFDAMEQALLKAVEAKYGVDPRQQHQLIHEYALSGQPPMMTHIWRNGDRQIVAAKGAAERMIKVANLPAPQRDSILEHVEQLAAKGFRILGVSSATYEGNTFPASQDDFDWQMEGLVAFYDPPKANIKSTFDAWYKAGMRILMITGDHAVTARHIATQIGIHQPQQVLTGEEVIQMTEGQLRTAVQETQVFARMYPDAKLRVVEALKANGEVVAMSGDGVNDGPALKAAQVGVAMGLKGTEIAKSAASLVLLNDDLSIMTTAIQMGRRIYNNLRNAIRYIISIHLPMIMVVLVPLLYQWPYPHILLPLHIIFLELVMDPTAAIAFENEPGEKNSMEQPPRPANNNLFSWRELTLSILQGLAITIVVLSMYRWAVGKGLDETHVRSITFATLVFSNLMLTLSNRSFVVPITKTLGYRNPSLPYILLASVLMLVAILYIRPLAHLFQMAPLSFPVLAYCLLAATASMLWFEWYKVWKFYRSNQSIV